MNWSENPFHAIVPLCRGIVISEQGLLLAALRPQQGPAEVHVVRHRLRQCIMDKVLISRLFLMFGGHVPLFLVYFLVLDGFTSNTGQDRNHIIWVRVDDNYIWSSSWLLPRNSDSVNVVVCWWLWLKVKVSRGIKPSPHNGLEPAPLTSEALVAQNRLIDLLPGRKYLWREEKTVTSSLNVWPPSPHRHNSSIS
jgi:hypothetical protein